MLLLKLFLSAFILLLGLIGLFAGAVYTKMLFSLPSLPRLFGMWGIIPMIIWMTEDLLFCPVLFRTPLFWLSRQPKILRWLLPKVKGHEPGLLLWAGTFLLVDHSPDAYTFLSTNFAKQSQSALDQGIAWVAVAAVALFVLAFLASFFYDVLHSGELQIDEKDKTNTMLFFLPV